MGKMEGPLHSQVIMASLKEKSMRFEYMIAALVQEKSQKSTRETLKNQGFLDFIAIEKPSIATLRPSSVLPDQAIMQMEVLSIGGELLQSQETLDFNL